MQIIHRATALAAALAAPLLLSSPATAQVAAGQGTAVVNLEAAIVQSSAFQAATKQIQTTYKTQIDAYRARETALQTQLQPAQTELQTLQANPATPRATLEAKVNAYRARAQTAQTELGRLAAPFGRPTAYAREQVEVQIETALRNAMNAKRVNVVLSPENVIGLQPGGNLTADVVAQLNTLVKTVSVTPPANWQPGQRAAQPAPPAAAPQGR